MNKQKPRVAILTDYLLHPKNDDLLAVAENQNLLQLIAYLRNDLDCDVELFQVSSVKERRFDGVKVIGIDTLPDNLGMFPGLNSVFAQAGLGYDLRIYYHWNIAYPFVSRRSVVVSHGVYWDTASAQLNRLNPIDREEWKKRHLYAIAASEAFVIEDRNTANVIKSTWPGYDHRLVYIPPGIDLSEFTPAGNPKDEGEFEILCPQDFTLEQGINDIVALGRLLLGSNPEIKLHIIGQMKNFEEAIFLANQLRPYSNCRFDWVPLAHIPRTYQKADIALFPSRATEGASRYAIQAMAAGLPVIAGLAGGLSELVVDGWNGYLVQPDLKSYQGSVSLLHQDFELRKQMSENSRRMAAGYSVSRWKDRWNDLLKSLIPGRL